MKKDGTVDQTTLKNAITIDGDPVSYTNEDSTRITTWLQDNWDKTIGNRHDRSATSRAHAKRAGSSAISFAAHRRELGTIVVHPVLRLHRAFLLAPDGHRHRGRLPIRRRQLHPANFNKLSGEIPSPHSAHRYSYRSHPRSSVYTFLVGAPASYALVIGSAERPAAPHDFGHLVGSSLNSAA